MSAELLRQAATILRERAEAATPEGGWHFTDGGVRADGTEPADSGLIAFISLMSPGVGLALADWLELVASTPNFDSWLRSALRGATADGARQAMFLARLIVGAS